MKRIKSILFISLLIFSIGINKTYAITNEESPNEVLFDNQKEEISNDNNLSYLKIPFILLIGAGVVILLIGNINKEDKNIPLKQKKLDLTKLDKDIDELELKEKIFKLYKDVQSARTKNRIKLLEPLVTNELYQKYDQEIKKLKEEKQKIVITDILNEETKILSIEEKEEKKYINAYLHVIQYDYSIDKDKKILKGTNDSKYQAEFNLTILYNNSELKLDKMKCTGKWISK